MKTIFLILAVLLFGVSQLEAQVNTDSLPKARLLIKTDTYDFGYIETGEKTSHTFQFENVGNAPLIIDKVLTTCGCTVPEWTKEPISPGNSGQVKVVFDSTGKMGRQNKIITIRSNNTEGDVRLILSGMIIPKKE
jgi:hypothetical protein